MMPEWSAHEAIGEPAATCSTRGAAPALGFADVLLAGLATDGGLYVPERGPAAAGVWREAPERGYAATAVDVMWPFVDGSSRPTTGTRLVADAYRRPFDDPDVVPVRQLDDDLHLAELFGGPDAGLQGHRPAAGRAGCSTGSWPAGASG